MGIHALDRLEDVDGEYIIVCTCGWRSPPGPLAHGVGDAWDEHRVEPGDGA